MALAGCIIQVNLNHSASAQDLLLQAMAERGLGPLAVVAEPYRVPQHNGTGDTTGRAAIFRAGSNDSPAIRTIETGQGFVIVKWGEMYVAGLYASPNAPVSSQKMLDEIRDRVAPFMAKDILILGDLNAKSTLWGSPRTNARGEIVAEWAAELDLQLLNEGRKSTCVRWQGESIVDLTWASPSVARKVKQWEVMEDTETSSDHRYILISLKPGEWKSKNRSQPGREKEERKEDP